MRPGSGGGAECGRAAAGSGSFAAWRGLLRAAAGRARRWPGGAKWERALACFIKVRLRHERRGGGRAH